MNKQCKLLPVKLKLWKRLWEVLFFSPLIRIPLLSKQEFNSRISVNKGTERYCKQHTLYSADVRQIVTTFLIAILPFSFFCQCLEAMKWQVLSCYVEFCFVMSGFIWKTCLKVICLLVLYKATIISWYVAVMVIVDLQF